MRKVNTKIIAAILAATVLPTMALTITEDFTSDIANNGFTVFSDISPTSDRGVSFDTTAGTMTVAYRYQVGDTLEQPWSSMSRAFSGNAGADWSMSTNFDISDMAFSQATAGVTAMSSAANFGGTVDNSLGYSARVVVGFDEIIGFRIYGPGNQVTLVRNDNVGTVSSSLLTLNFSGSYDTQGDLTLAASLFNGATQLGTLSHTVLESNVAGGDYFGSYVGKRFGGNPGTVVFNDLAITAIPEPSTLLLMMSALLSLVFLRRARR